MKRALVLVSLLLAACWGTAARAELLPALAAAWNGKDGIAVEVEAGVAAGLASGRVDAPTAAEIRVRNREAGHALAEEPVALPAIPWQALRTAAVAGVDSWLSAGTISIGVRDVLLERHVQFFDKLTLYTRSTQ